MAAPTLTGALPAIQVSPSSGIAFNFIPSRYFSGAGTITYSATVTGTAVTVPSGSVGAEQALAITTTAAVTADTTNTITITATNAANESTAAMMTVTRHPIATSRGTETFYYSPGRTRALSAGAETLDVGFFVNHRWRGPWTVRSSNTAVATARISGASLVWTPVNQGIADLILVATGGIGSTDPTDRTFLLPVTVTVPIPDVPIVNAGTNRVGIRGSADQTSTLSVTNPAAGQALTYSATSSNENVVTASVSGTTLTLSPAGTTTGEDGISTITVTATYTNHPTITGTATFIFSNVDGPALAHEIPDQTLEITQTYRAAGRVQQFICPRPFTLSTRSLGPSVATARLSSDADPDLTVTAVDLGTASIELTATDSLGNTATDTFVTTVTIGSPPTDGSLKLRNHPQNRTMRVGDTLTIDLDTFIFYNATSYAVTGAGVGATYNTETKRLVLTATTVGRFTVTIAAQGRHPTSGGQHIINSSFVVTVLAAEGTENQPPTVVTNLPDRTLQAGTSVAFDVAKFFSDQDALAYTAATTAATTVLRFTLSGSTLTLLPQGAGSGTVTVTATDAGGLATSDTFDVTVTAARPTNAAPIKVGTIADRRGVVGGEAQTLDVSDYFDDPTDTLTYSATSSNTASVAVTVSGDTLTMTPGTAGASTITVTATDTASQSVSQTFDFTTSAVVNPAPTTVGTISSQRVTIGGDAVTFLVTAFFSDTDTLTYGVSGFAIVTINSTTGSLTITPPSTGTPVTATVTVTATDTAGQTATQSFSVALVAAPPPPNPAPTPVGTIPQHNAIASGAAQTLSLTAYFSDTDALTYSATSNNTAIVAVSVSGTTLTMTPGATTGTATIAVTATDTANQSAQQTFSFVVSAATPPTDPPPTAVGTIPNQTAQISSASQSLTVTSYFSDNEPSLLRYAAASSTTAVVTVTVNSVSGVLSMIPGATIGTSTITITASDRSAQTVTQTFTFTTVAAGTNTPPTLVGTVPNRSYRANAGAQRFAITGFFSDQDALTYTAGTSAASVVTPLISGSDVVLTPRAVGMATITLTATDTASQSVSTTFTVTITAALNPPPTTVGTIGNRVVQQGHRLPSFDVSRYFTDQVGDTLTYSARSSNTAVATATIPSRTSTLFLSSGGMLGTTTITVTAIDSANQGVDQTFTLTVQAGAVMIVPPSPVGTIPNQTMVAGTIEDLDVGFYFSSPTSSLGYQYTASSSTTRVAGATILRVVFRGGGSQSNPVSILRLAGLMAGTTTITVTATLAPGGGQGPFTATQSFTLTVTPAPPSVITQQRPTLLRPFTDVVLELGDNHQFIVGDHFAADPVYGPALADAYVATPGIVGFGRRRHTRRGQPIENRFVRALNVFYITALKLGTTAVTVTARYYSSTDYFSPGDRISPPTVASFNVSVIPPSAPEVKGPFGGWTLYYSP